MQISSIYEVNFIYSLFLTIIIEGVVIYSLVSYFYKQELKTVDILSITLLPSFATLPYVWFLFPVFLRDNYTLYLWVAEFFVLIIEMFILSYLLKFSLKNALFLSFSANLISYLIGTWLAKIFI